MNHGRLPLASPQHRLIASPERPKPGREYGGCEFAAKFAWEWNGFVLAATLTTRVVKKCHLKLA